MSTQKRTILITGGTANLGFYTALNIARERPHDIVVIASRSDKEDSATAINQQLKQKNVVYMRLDLANLGQVQSFSKEWENKALPPIDTFIMNAGLQFPGEVTKTVDGYESTFAINHLGHAQLFHLLLPHLDDHARIVVVASGTHDPAQKTGMPEAVYTDAETLAHPTPETTKNPGRQRYTSSKLCNVLWTYALDGRVKAAGKHITVAAVDPGLMPGSGLAREASSVERFLWNKVLPKVVPLLRVAVSNNIHTPGESASNLTWVAIDPEARKLSGGYYEGRKPIKSSVASYDERKQDDLWNWTVQTVNGQTSWEQFISA